MRSDFYALPYAAQQAIRKGERDARVARNRGFTVAQLNARIAELEAQLAATTTPEPTDPRDDINHPEHDTVCGWCGKVHRPTAGVSEMVESPRDAAARLWMEMTGDWPKDLCEEDAETLTLFTQAFARYRTPDPVLEVVKEALESAQSQLDLLRTAVEQDDPKAELLMRVTDLWKENAATLQTINERGKSV